MITKEHSPYRIIAQNRRARFDYEILEEVEAGIALMGSEIKSLRAGRANINEAYAEEKNGELFLVNAHIPEYKFAGRFSHEPKRSRKLLLHKKEINKLLGKIKLRGFTIIPLVIYINNRNIAKVKLALVKGKKEYDKRAAIKEREWKREKERIMKEKD